VVRPRTVVYAVAVSPSGTLACAGRPLVRDYNEVLFRDLTGSLFIPPAYWEMEPSACSIWSLSFSADGNYLAAAAREIANGGILDGAGAHWWDRRNAGSGDFLEGAHDGLRAYAVAFAPTGHTVGLTRERCVVVRDRPERGERLVCELPSDWAPALVFAPGGERIVGASSFLFFADAAGQKRPDRVRTGFRAITALALSPDGQTLLVGGRPGAVELYGVASRARRAAYDFDAGAVHSVAFAPDGLTFAVGAEKGLLVCDVD
jgi:WD40 repeat protein